MLLILVGYLANAQTLQLSSPNGGETWLGGSVQTITWTYSNVDNIKIEYSLNNGLNWIVISASTPASALSYAWTVPSIGSSQVKVRITNTLQFTQDESNTVFTIPEPTVDVVYPNGGESFGAGTGQYIEWLTTGVSTLKVQYTTNNGSSWTDVGSFNALDGYCNWSMPTTITSQARIRAFNIENSVNRDSSLANFSIVSTSSLTTDKYKGGNYDGYSMVSSLSDTIKVATPNGGESLYPANTTTISWTYRNVDQVKLEYSTDNGSTWNLIVSNIPASQLTYTWAVPNTPSTQCLVKVSSLNNAALYDLSNAVFTINNSYVSLIYPNGGESFGTGTGQYIEWDFNAVTTVKLEYSDNNGSTWTTIGTAPAADKYANWLLPSTSGTQYLVRVSDNSVSTVSDNSDMVFNLFTSVSADANKFKGGNNDGYSLNSTFLDSVKVVSPNGGENWAAGSIKNITWTYNDVDNVSIEFSLDDGQTWTTLAASVPASQLSYSWTVPTTPSYTCRIRIKDISRNISDQNDAVFVIPNSSIQLLYPNGGENFATGSGQYIEWTYTDLTTVKLEYSTNNGSSWTTIGTAPAADKYANWDVPATASSQLLIRVSDNNNASFIDQSNATFSSYNSPTLNQNKYIGGLEDGYAMYAMREVALKVLSPNGGEIWGNATTEQIKWTVLNTTDDLKLEYSIDNETTWILIADSIPFTQTNYNWYISSPTSSICKVRISTMSGLYFDKSDNFFTIANTTGIVTNSLNTNSFCSGSSITVNFTISTSFISGNRFIAQLSDSIGNFSGPVRNIGEITSTIPQTINVTIPSIYYSSSLYRIRVIGTNPPTIGTNNGTNITISPLPNIRLGNDTLICQGTSLTLNAGNSASSYLWNTTATTSSISVNQAGTYHVGATNACGITRDTIIVQLKLLPNVNLGNDTLICANTSLTLDAGNTATTYLWNNSLTTRTINVVTPGTYSVSASNSCGSSSDQVVVGNITPINLELGNDKGICTGQTITLDAGNSGSIFQWSTGSTSQSIIINNAGTYTVNVNNGCGNVSDQIVIYDGSFSVNAGTDQTICTGNSAILNATGANNYTWSTGATSNSITVSPVNTTTYTVTATNIYNCTASDQVVVSLTTTSTIGAASSSPTICINNALTNITHAIIAASGISNPNVSGANGLPYGVSASWYGNTITISGTPTESGTFNYTIPLIGSCVNLNATGTIIVKPTPLIANKTYTICTGTAFTYTPEVSDAVPSGTTYSWSAPTLTPSTSIGGSSASTASVVTLSSTGSGNWTVPLGVGSVTVECWGGGGGGGSSNNGTASGGSGGGGGAYSKSSFAVNEGEIYYYSVGSGGVGSPAGSSAIGANGGDTWFNASTTYPFSSVNSAPASNSTGVLAKGGLGGSGNGGAAGVGGSTTSGFGDIKYSGGNGGIGSTNGGAGGGSSAGIANNGVAGTNGSGTAGAIAPTGGGNGGAGSSTTNGVSGSIPGGGGGGSDDLSTASGGNGARGGIKISYNPTGVSQTLTNSTSSIATATYTVAANGCSITNNFTLTVSVTPTPSATISGSTTVCLNAASPDITFTNPMPLPVTVSYNINGGVNQTINISANSTNTVSVPTSSAATYIYNLISVAYESMPTCATTLSGAATVTINSNNIASAASISPTLCINTPLTNITHAITGATGIGSSIGLPSGVIAAWSNDTLTISGTPTTSGVFNYNIPLTGGCGNASATGTIIVKPTNTISAASISPTLCVNTPLTNITHATTGATGIGSSIGLPSGVIAAWSNDTLTISGTPTTSGIFNYNIPLTGGCGNASATGTIIVKPTNTISAASINPTLCINTPITNITHATAGATGIGLSTGLPSGVMAAWSNDTLTISGTPTTSGVFNYNIPLTGGCGNLSATGFIIINQTTISTSNQVVCSSYSWNGNVYTASGTYTYTTTNANGCDSTVVLNLTINQPSFSTTTQTACSSYNWNGNVYTTSGTYTYTTTNVNGCDSTVVLNLTINQPSFSTTTQTACSSYNWNGNVYTTSGTYTYTTTNTNGCDSSAILNLTINQPSFSATTQTACSSYNWNGNNYTTSGTYTYTTTNANGCDSTVVLNLTINQPSFSATTQTACSSYNWNGNVYTTSGTYTYTTTNVNGCDSTVILNLTINQPSFSATTQTTCSSYNWNGNVYTTSGTYTYTTTNVNGCDSTVVLNLTINQPSFSATTQTACSSYNWNGNNYTTSGTYTYTTTNANGCDSTVVLNLTINQPSFSATTQTACSSYNWNGNNYTTSGTYTYTTTNSNGCDSTVVLNLTINQPSFSATTQTACSSYSWNGNVYTTSGTYTYTTTTANGCDSTVILNLTINQPTSYTTSQTACSSYNWNGNNYTTSGTYTYTTTNANGCDSTVVLNLTINQPSFSATTQTACSSYSWNGNNYTTSGTYTYTTTNTNGCDSTVVLNLTINQPSVNSLNLSSCDSIIVNGQLYYSSGNYIQTLVNYVGCDSVLTLNITIYTSPQPVILASGPISFCIGDSVVLSLSNPTQYQQISWNNGFNTSQITVDTNGVYAVNVMDINSCTASTSITISVIPCSFSFNSETFYLTSNSSLQSNVLLNEASSSGITIDTIPLLSPLRGAVRISSNGEIIYSPINNFSGYDKFVLRGCNILQNCANDTIYIIIRPLAQNDYFSTNSNINTLAINGNVLLNDAGSSIQSSFNLISNVNNGNLQVDANGNFQYKPTINYCGLDSFRYQICDTNNLCSIATCIFDVTCKEIIINTGFSPNGDGLNDVWVISNIEGTTNVVSVFDRWGTMVRTYNNYDNVSNVWNGSNKSGAELPSGTYFYSIDIENKSSLKGWVEITR